MDTTEPGLDVEYLLKEIGRLLITIRLLEDEIGRMKTEIWLLKGGVEDA